MIERDEKALRSLGFQAGTFRNIAPEGKALFERLMEKAELPCGCAVHNGLRCIGWTARHTGWWFRCKRCKKDHYYNFTGFMISEKEFQTKCVQVGEFLSRQRKLPF